MIQINRNLKKWEMKPLMGVLFKLLSACYHVVISNTAIIQHVQYPRVQIDLAIN